MNKKANRLDIELKNLVSSGATLPRIIQALAAQGIVGDTAEKIAEKYLLSKISKKNSGKRQSSILSQRSRRSNNGLRRGIQGLAKRGADRKALMDFAIRNGAQRQTAVKLVNEILGEAASTPRAHLVQGGSASPR